MIEYATRIKSNFMLQTKKSLNVELYLNKIDKDVYQERDIAIHHTSVKFNLIT